MNAFLNFNREKSRDFKIYCPLNQNADDYTCFPTAQPLAGRSRKNGASWFWENYIRKDRERNRGPEKFKMAKTFSSGKPNRGSVGESEKEEEGRESDKEPERKTVKR